MTLTRRKGKPLKRRTLKKASSPASIPLPKVKGVKVDGWKRGDVVLVPATDKPDHPDYLPLHPKRVPVDSTWYLVRKTDNGIEGYVTRTALGTFLAWSWCGSCHLAKCECSHGPFVPRSVEYIYDKDAVSSSGGEWSHLHPNYKGSFRKVRAEGSQRLSAPKWDRTGKVTASKASQPVTAAPVATEDKPTTGKRPLKRRKPTTTPATTPVVTQPERNADHLLKNGSVDKAATDREAQRQAASQQEAVEKLLGNTTRPKKSLTRKRK